MPRGIEGNEIASRKPPSTQKNMAPQSSAGKGQKTLLGFFNKKTITSSANTLSGLPQSSPTPAPKSQPVNKATTPRGSSGSLTPAPSSDGPEPPSPELSIKRKPLKTGDNKENGLPSPITPTNGGTTDGNVKKEDQGDVHNSPSRKVSVKPNLKHYGTNY